MKRVSAFVTFVMLVMLVIACAAGRTSATNDNEILVTEKEPSNVPDENVVVEPQNGWAHTWGGYSDEIMSQRAPALSGWDGASDVAIDSAQNIYAVGYFVGSFDFDPGRETDWHEYNDGGAYISKISNSGDFIWARTWSASCRGISIDGNDDLYVTGYYWDMVDFDPGPNTVERTGSGSFLSKFDSEGSFLWVRTWGFEGYSGGFDITTNRTEQIFVLGKFTGDIDFDPGVEADIHSSGPSGRTWVYVSSFDQDGNFYWAQTFGGWHLPWGDATETIQIACDFTDGIYITGGFGQWEDDEGDYETITIDFNPEEGVENRTCAKGGDTFLLALTNDGDYRWVNTWPGAGSGVCVDEDGNIYVTGEFAGRVDFDPGSGTVEHATERQESQYGSWYPSGAYLSKFDSIGNFQWATTWAGTDGFCAGTALAVDLNGNIYVTGEFNSEVDFDPRSSIDIITAEDYMDVFLSKFDSNGEYQWVRSWGGTGVWADDPAGIAVDSFGNTYVTGDIWGVADLNPGPALENYEGGSFLIKILPDGGW